MKGFEEGQGFFNTIGTTAGGVGGQFKTIFITSV